MKRYNGGSEVKGGYYFRLGEWEITTVSGETGTLPGGPEEQFVRAPVAALLIGAPVLGAAFAMFLPLVGFLMPIYAVAKRLRRPAETAHETAS
jgi:hypothetical protein